MAFCTGKCRVYSLGSLKRKDSFCFRVIKLSTLTRSVLLTTWVFVVVVDHGGGGDVCVCVCVQEIRESSSTSFTALRQTSYRNGSLPF